MSLKSDTEILTISNTQAKELAGRMVTIGSETYCFKNYDARHRGQPPWRSGAEGKAYPLLDYDRAVAAYLKFFTRPTRERLDRTAWLIGQQIHTWLAGLAGAPLAWVDTRHASRPAATTLDFAGCLARAVPGQTWLDVKNAIHDEGLPFPEDFRRRCVRDLIMALSVLEQQGIVHGDLSPNNIVIDLAARPAQPALYLIDFDAFVAPAADGIEALTMAEGGTFGTDGYCPPDLSASAAEGEGPVAPYSDRYARDMLLMELLVLDRGLSADDPPSSWSSQLLQVRHAAWQARSDSGWVRALSHLDPTTLLTLAEPGRPASTELAEGLGLSLPAKHALHRMTRGFSSSSSFSFSSTPAVLGHSLDSTRSERPKWQPSGRAPRTPATLNFIIPWRWSRPASYPGYTTLWQDLKVALVCVAILFAPFLMALIVLLFSFLGSLFYR